MKFKNKIFLISLLILLLISISVVSANQNDALLTNTSKDVLTLNNELQMESVNNENSSNDYDNTLSSEIEWSYGQFQNKIDGLNSGETLILDCDVRYNGDRGHMDITQTITIDGKNHYINGNEAAGIFRFDNAEDGITLTLKNLLLEDSRSDNGAVIHTKHNVNIYIINCTFIRNQVIEDGGAIYFDSTGTLDIKDSKFINCRSQIVDSSGRKRNGGAINTQDGVLKIDNCIFINNTAGFGYGGALYIQSECSGVTNSVFINNTARSRFGGAIYVETDNKNGLAIDNCNFTNNTSITLDRKAGSGGAVYYDGSGLLRITNSNFIKNKVLGSATWNKNEYEASKTTYMAKGGAVSSIHDISIGNCTFIKNHAVDYGGAVNTEEAIH